MPALAFTTRAELAEWLAQEVPDEEIEVLGLPDDDSLTPAVVGLVDVPGRGSALLYDAATVVELLMQRNGCTYEEAVDDFHYNVEGVCRGERAGAPLFLFRPDVAEASAP